MTTDGRDDAGNCRDDPDWRDRRTVTLEEFVSRLRWSRYSSRPRAMAHAEPHELSRATLYCMWIGSCGSECWVAPTCSRRSKSRRSLSEHPHLTIPRDPVCQLSAEFIPDLIPPAGYPLLCLIPRTNNFDPEDQQHPAGAAEERQHPDRENMMLMEKTQDDGMLGSTRWQPLSDDEEGRRPARSQRPDEELEPIGPPLGVSAAVQGDAILRALLPMPLRTMIFLWPYLIGVVLVANCLIVYILHQIWGEGNAYRMNGAYSYSHVFMHRTTYARISRDRARRSHACVSGSFCFHFVQTLIPPTQAFVQSRTTGGVTATSRFSYLSLLCPRRCASVASACTRLPPRSQRRSPTYTHPSRSSRRSPGRRHSR